MSKSSIPPIWAGIARELSRRARHHADESRRLREQYTSGFPVRQRSVRALGCDTNVYETVPGTSRHPPLLLIHGGVIEAASWMAALGETPGLGTGRRVLLPDLPAHGASAFLAPSRLLAWLEAFVDSEIGHQPFDLCGHSMGGAIALYYAARHGGRLRRLVLCAPAGTGQVLPRVWPEPWNTGLLDFWPLHKP